MDLAKQLGIDGRGGAALVMAGEIVGQGTMTDENTGELKSLTEVGWFGGSSYILDTPGSPISKVAENSPVVVLTPFKKGKKGWYAHGDTRLLTVDDKAVTKTLAAASGN